MTCRPWFAFYTADYDRDTRDLDHEQHGIYFLLLKATWDQPTCSLPDDLSFIRKLLPRMHGHTFNRLVPPILKRFFLRDSEGAYYNKRLTNERQTADKRSANQSQIAKKRWENKAPIDAGAMPSQSQSQSHSKKEREEPSASPQKAVGRKRTQCPPDWTPDCPLDSWDQKQLIEFRDYHISRGNLMADWNRAWGTWTRKPWYNTNRPPDPPDTATIIPLKGFHARDGSPEMAAWDGYWYRTRGTAAPRSKRIDGYLFESQWPPGHSEEVRATSPPERTVEGRSLSELLGATVRAAAPGNGRARENNGR